MRYRPIPANPDNGRRFVVNDNLLTRFAAGSFTDIHRPW
jgi:hypothetical protein